MMSSRHRASADEPSRDGVVLPDAIPLRRHAVFHTGDAGAAESAGARVFSPHHLLVRPRDTVEAEINSTVLRDVRLIFMRYVTPVEVRSRSPLGYYSVHVPLHGGGHVSFGADRAEVDTDHTTAAVFSPDDEPRMRWTGHLDQLAVKIPEATLRRHLQMLTAEPLNRPLWLEHRMDGGTGGRRWADLLRMIVGIVDQQRGGSLSPVLATQLEQMLLSGLLLTQPHTHSDRLVEPVASAAPRAVREASELMRAHPEAPWTVPVLASRTGVSVRSLQEGFRRIHGTTPTRFLRDVRLDHARALLLDRSQPDRPSVTDVATSLGFSNVGRFAAAYRTRFGVLPSSRPRR